MRLTWEIAATDMDSLLFLSPPLSPPYNVALEEYRPQERGK